MATLDIRNNDGDIDRIQWGNSDFVQRSAAPNVVMIKDATSRITTVRSDEIDDLIKALQKAKELWLDKT